jgi:hypothetical protein
MTESEQPPEQPGSRPGASGPGIPPAPGATPAYGAVPPPYGAPPPGAPPGYPPPPPGTYGYGYGYAYPGAKSGTNGMAIAAMICGICGFACLVPGLVGIVLGIVSLPQIKRNGQSGRGMAITGIVMGALWIVVFLVLVAVGHHNAQISGPGGAGN